LDAEECEEEGMLMLMLLLLLLQTRARVCVCDAFVGVLLVPVKFCCEFTV